jgi:solute carrier family 25 folate transporter 32
MFVVRTRLQTEAVHNLVHPNNKTRSTIVQTVQQLYAEGGLPTFWRGMTANLLGLMHVAIQFPIYEQLKSKFRERRNKGEGDETTVDLLLASGLSKSTASLLTYPHEVIRSRMMDARTSVTFVGTCRRIYVTEGAKGFYTGLPISLIRVIPNTMLTFWVYETTLRYMRRKLEAGFEKE